MESGRSIFTAAAIQAAPVYLNRDATVDKACVLTPPPTGFEFTGPQSWRLIEELRGRVNSASPEELRALVESLLASLPAK